MDNESYVDSKQITYLHELGGSSLVQKMIDLFLENAPLRIAEMHQREETQDWEGVCQSVHKLKSSVGNFGAHELFALCAQIEEMIREKRIEGIAPLLRNLEVLLTHVLDSLRLIKERFSA